MKLNRMAQFCALVLCIGALPGCGGDKKKHKHKEHGVRKEIHYKEENHPNKRSITKEYTVKK